MTITAPKVPANLLVQKGGLEKFNTLMANLYKGAENETDPFRRVEITRLRRDCRLIISQCSETIFNAGLRSLQAVGCAQACLMRADIHLRDTEARERAEVALLTIAQAEDGWS